MLTAAAVTGILTVPGGYAFADAGAEATAAGSPGIASGNIAQTPIQAPLNICGNSINVAGGYSAAYGSDCANVGIRHHVHAAKRHCSEPERPAPVNPQPEVPASPAPKPPVHHAPAPQQHQPRQPGQQARAIPAPAPQLAETGGGPATIVAGGLGAVLLAGGAVMYRRGRAAAGLGR